MRVVQERPPQRTELFQIKGLPHTLLTLKLFEIDETQGVFEALDERVRQAPALLHRAPIVIDLSEAALPESFDLARFQQAVRAAGVIPVAVCGLEEAFVAQAEEAGIPVLAKPRVPAPRADSPPAKVVKVEAAERPAPKPQVHVTTTVTEPIRSGRRIYARGDLVVLAPVSPGAEIMADGHIHVYGSLRGRALAGANGNRSARVFCQSLEAELVSIAGLYRVSEDIDRGLFKKNVHAYLDEDRLCIEELV